MDDFPTDEQSLFPFFGDRSPAQWPRTPVVTPQHSYLFASQPQGFPSRHNSNQHEDFFHNGRMSEAFDVTGLNLTGDVLLLEHTSPLPIEQGVIDSSPLNHSGTDERGQVTVGPCQDGQYQSTTSNSRVPHTGALTPASNPAWPNRRSRLPNPDCRFLALPAGTPTKRPLEECRRPTSGSPRNACTEDIDAAEWDGWKWSQHPSEHAQEAPWNHDDFGPGRFCNAPHNRVSADGAVVAAGDLLDFFGQPQTDGMIASNDLEAIVRIWSQARRMQ